MRCPKTSDSTAGLCLREVISTFTWKSDLNVPVALFRLTEPVVPLQFCSGPRVQLSRGAESLTEQWEAHLYGLAASVGLEPGAGAQSWAWPRGTGWCSEATPCARLLGSACPHARSPTAVPRVTGRRGTPSLCSGPARDPRPDQHAAAPPIPCQLEPCRSAASRKPHPPSTWAALAGLGGPWTTQ